MMALLWLILLSVIVDLAVAARDEYVIGRCQLAVVVVSAIVLGLGA